MHHFNPLLRFAGACTSYFGLDLLFNPEAEEYRQELQKTVTDSNLKETLSSLSKQLLPILAENNTSPFIQGAIDVNKERLTELADFIILHVLNSLKGNNPDVLQGAMQTILKSIVAFTAEDHKLLYASCLAYKQDPNPESLHQLTEQFAPLADTLMEKAGLDENGISKILNGDSYIPYFPKPEAIRAVIRKLLIEECATWYLEFKKIDAPSEEEEVGLLATIDGVESLSLMAKTIALGASSPLCTSISQESSTIAKKISESFFSNHLRIEDQLTIARTLEHSFSKENPITKTLVTLLHPPLEQVIHTGLQRIVLHSPLHSGSATDRLEAYAKQLFEKITDPKVIQSVKAYSLLTQTLTKETDALETLRKEALHETGDALVLLKKQIETKEKLVVELKKGIDKKEYEKLLASIQPVIVEVLRDMGYATPESLPVPKALQETTYTELTTSLLPELFLEKYGKTLQVLETITVESNERIEHVASLKERFGDDQLVNTARTYAQLLVKSIESTLAVDSVENATKGVEWLRQQLQDNRSIPKELKAILNDNEEALTAWATKKTIDGLEFVESRYNKKIEDEVEATIVHLFDNITGSIEKLEKEDPKRTFEFVLTLLTELTVHLKTVNQITKQEGKQHMYEVDPLRFTQEFDNRKLLDPALSSYKIDLTIRQLEIKIATLEDRLQKKKGNAEVIKRELEDAHLSLTRFAEEKELLAKDNFYKGYISYFLSLSGINKAEDLPGPEPLKQHLWDALTGDQGTTMAADLISKVFQPEKLDKYLRIALESANKSLLEPGTENESIPCSEEDKKMTKAALGLLKEIRTALPGTLVGTFAQIDQLQKLPANIVADVMRDVFKNYSLTKMVESSLIEGTVAAKELIDEGFPKTKEEADKIDQEKARLHRRDIKEYHKQAGETVYSGTEKIKQVAIERWDTFQKAFNQKIEFYFGKVGISIKKFLDPIVSVIGIDCAVRPLFSLFNFCMKGVYYIYSKQIVYHAEHFRRCFSETPIHQNFGFKVAHQLKKSFPVSR